MTSYYLTGAIFVVILMLFYFRNKANKLELRNQEYQVKLYDLQMEIKGLKEDAKAWEEFTKSINSNDRDDLIKRLHEQGAYK